MEENENALQVPEWKVDMCQQRIKSMIQEEDFSMSKSMAPGVNDISHNLGGKMTVKYSEIFNKSTAKKGPSGNSPG